MNFFARTFAASVSTTAADRVKIGVRHTIHVSEYWDTGRPKVAVSQALQITSIIAFSGAGTVIVFAHAVIVIVSVPVQPQSSIPLLAAGIENVTSNGSHDTEVGANV